MDDLTKEQAAVLKSLDFATPCIECGKPSSWTITVTCCGIFASKCIGCYARWETIVARRLGRVVECQGCKADGRLSWDWFRVVHL